LQRTKKCNPINQNETSFVLILKIKNKNMKKLTTKQTSTVRGGGITLQN